MHRRRRRRRLVRYLGQQRARVNTQKPETGIGIGIGIFCTLWPSPERRKLIDGTLSTTFFSLQEAVKLKCMKILWIIDWAYRLSTIASGVWRKAISKLVKLSASFWPDYGHSPLWHWQLTVSGNAMRCCNGNCCSSTSNNNNFISFYPSIYPPIRLFVYGEEQVAGLIEA